MTRYRNECGRCGGPIMFTDCVGCDGTGEWFGDDGAGPESGECPECDGDGYVAFCGSGGDWCQLHPRPGCEHVPSGTVIGVPSDVDGAR